MVHADECDVDILQGAHFGNILDVAGYVQAHAVLAEQVAVIPVYDGHEAEYTKSTPCADVVISDHMMPNLSEIDFYKFQRMRGCKVPDENKALIIG